MTAPAPGIQRDFWLASLVAASVALCLWFACVAPLAALAAYAALTLGRRSAWWFVLAAWLANQAAGFAFLSYPLDASTLLWGLAIGVAAFAALFAAQGVLRLAGWWRVPLAALAASAVDQAVLFAVALSPLGGVENFAFDIVGAVLALNMAAFAALCLLHVLAFACGCLQPRITPAA